MTQISFDICHNPRCLKFRKVLEILNSKNKGYKIIKYLEEGIEAVELKTIVSLNKISKDEIIRMNETSFKKLKSPIKYLSKDQIVN